MAKSTNTTSKSSKPTREPARSPEARERRLIAAAMDLAEKQLKDGTASPSVITHYLKLGSTREQEERDILKSQKELYKAKTDQIQSSKRIEELYSNAIAAMGIYAGDDDTDDYET